MTQHARLTVTCVFAMEAAVVLAEKAAIPAPAAVWLRPAWADRDCEKKESVLTVSDMNVAAFGPTFILLLLVRVWPYPAEIRTHWRLDAV